MILHGPETASNRLMRRKREEMVQMWDNKHTAVARSKTTPLGWRVPCMNSSPPYGEGKGKVDRVAQCTLEHGRGSGGPKGEGFQKGVLFFFLGCLGTGGKLCGRVDLHRN